MISDRKLVKEPHKVVDRFAPEFEKLLLAATVGVLAARPRQGKDADEAVSVPVRRWQIPQGACQGGLKIRGPMAA